MEVLCGIRSGAWVRWNSKYFNFRIQLLLLITCLFRCGSRRLTTYFGMSPASPDRAVEETTVKVQRWDLDRERIRDFGGVSLLVARIITVRMSNEVLWECAEWKVTYMGIVVTFFFFMSMIWWRKWSILTFFLTSKGTFRRPSSCVGCCRRGGWPLRWLCVQVSKVRRTISASLPLCLRHHSATKTAFNGLFHTHTLKTVEIISTFSA